MCNRYALTKKQERIITREYGTLELYFMERFNIAPTQNASVILVGNGKLVTQEMQWGLKVKWGLTYTWCINGEKPPRVNRKFRYSLPKYFTTASVRDWTCNFS